MSKVSRLSRDQQIARWQEAFEDYVIENFGGRDVTGHEYDEACDFADSMVEEDMVEEEVTRKAGEQMADLSKQSLLKFVHIRNESGFSSNLQFSIDAREAGIDLDQLGDARKSEDGGYEWSTPHGLLVERSNGRMELVA